MTVPDDLPIPAMDPLEVEETLWRDTEGAVGWDVGANMGQSVPQMVKRFEKVICWEPSWEACAVLRRNFGSMSQVLILPGALSSRSGHVVLAERPAPMETYQLVTPGMPYVQDAPGMEVWGPETGYRPVECSTADLIARQYGDPDFIKIDTEGHEYEILKGARDLISRGKTGLLIEFHTEALYGWCSDFLLERGYTVETVRNPRYATDSPMYVAHGWIRSWPIARQS